MATSPSTIGPDSAVTLDYTLTLEDGTEADSTRESEPLRFTMGDGTMVAGLEQALMGMAQGEHRTILLGPDDAFGYRDTGNIHFMARSEFPEEMELAPGVIVGFATPSGEEVPGMVLEVDEDQVQVDFNHPLAGHNITFDVAIVAVE